MSNFMNGVEIRGTPKTVMLTQEQPNGRKVAARTEVWIAAIMAVMTPEQREKVKDVAESMMLQREMQRPGVARVVADIIMPKGL